jgi:hypothetical protein
MNCGLLGCIHRIVFIDGYQRYGGVYHLHLQGSDEDGGYMFLGNGGTRRHNPGDNNPYVPQLFILFKVY